MQPLSICMKDKLTGPLSTYRLLFLDVLHVQDRGVPFLVVVTALHLVVVDTAEDVIPLLEEVAIEVDTGVDMLDLAMGEVILIALDHVQEALSDEIPFETEEGGVQAIAATLAGARPQ